MAKKKTKDGGPALPPGFSREPASSSPPQPLLSSSSNTRFSPAAVENMNKKSMSSSKLPPGFASAADEAPVSNAADDFNSLNAAYLANLNGNKKAKKNQQPAPAGSLMDMLKNTKSSSKPLTTTAFGSPTPSTPTTTSPPSSTLTPAALPKPSLPAPVASSALTTSLTARVEKLLIDFDRAASSRLPVVTLAPDSMAALGLAAGDPVLLSSAPAAEVSSPAPASPKPRATEAAPAPLTLSSLSPAATVLCEAWPLSIVQPGCIRVPPAPVPAVTTISSSTSTSTPHTIAKTNATTTSANTSANANAASSTTTQIHPSASSALAALRQLTTPPVTTPIKRFSSPRTLTSPSSSSALASPPRFTHTHPASATTPAATKAPAQSLVGPVGSHAVVVPLPHAPVPVTSVLFVRIHTPSTSATTCTTSTTSSTPPSSSSLSSSTLAPALEALLLSHLSSRPFLLFSPITLSFLGRPHTYLPIAAVPVPACAPLLYDSSPEPPHSTSTATPASTVSLRIVPLLATAATHVLIADSEAAEAVKVRMDLTSGVYVVENGSVDATNVAKDVSGELAPAVTSTMIAPATTSSSSSSSAPLSSSSSVSSSAPSPPAVSDPLASSLAALSLSSSYSSSSSSSSSSTSSTPSSSLTTTTTSTSAAFANIGGLGPQIASITEALRLPLTLPQIFTRYGIKPPRGVLLHGPPGTGKTLLARAVASEAFARFYSVSATELVGKYVGEAERKLRDVFLEAARTAPSVVFIDEIDALCPDRAKVTDQLQQRLVTTLLNILDGAYDMRGVALLAATNRPNALDPALRRPGRLDREVEVGIPGKEARADIFRACLSRVHHSVSDAQIRNVSEFAHGYVGADIALVVREAGLHCLRRAHAETFHDGALVASPQEPVLTEADLRHGLASVRPSAMRQVALDVPDVHWVDVGGQEEVKARLQEAFEWPLLHPELFSRLGVPPPKGILLYGPPGCSKTLLAKALATESSRNFIAVKGPELFSKWVGDSEKAVREVFRKARAAAPSIIFFDEIDAIAAGRGSGGGDEVVERVLSQLLVELDGVQPLVNVTVLAATNRPDILDKALLRPGRIDRVLYVSPPDLASTKEIYRIEFRKLSVSEEAHSEEGLSQLALASYTKRFSGAEISAVCREAALRALTENVDAVVVELRHLLDAVQATQGRISPSMLDFYENYQKVNGLTNI